MARRCDIIAALGRLAAVSRIGVIVLVSTAQRATYREVFAVAEFRALWLAQLLSVAGDQLAKVALTVLVYDRTRSPLLTANS